MSYTKRLITIGISIVVILSVVGMGTAIAAPMLSVSGSGGTTTPGGTVDVSVTLENTGNETANGPAVNITDLPSGWSIQSVDGDGGTVRGDTVLFLSLSAGSSVTPTYTLSVPDDVSAGEYTLTGQVLVSGTPQDTVNLTVTVKRPLEFSGQGDKTTVQKATKPNAPPTLRFSLTNNANTTVTAPSINITDYPAGWNITNTGGDGTWGQSDEAFIYVDIGGGMSKTSSFKFQTPDDVTNGTYTVTAELVRNGSAVDSTTVTVTLTGTLSQAYDQDGDDTVDKIAEVQSAVDDFSGGDLTIAEVQALINEWASN